MAEQPIDRPRLLKRLHYRRLAIIVMFVLIVLLALPVLLAMHHAKTTTTSSHTWQRFSNAMPNDAVVSASLEQWQSRVSQQEKTLATLNQHIIALQHQAAHTQTPVLTAHYHALLTRVQTLENNIQQLKLQQSAKPTTSATTAAFPALGSSHNGFRLTAHGMDPLKLIPRTQFSHLPLKNPQTYVPAGTHVLGVLLEGADLVADRYDQHNPKPILIRLLAQGTLPNHHHSHLKDCVITAAMTGDISSQRGDVRLERLSCVRPNQAIIDVPVFGTVATHAKEGIAGQLYTREHQRLWAAALSGTLAGIANGVSQGNVNTSNSIFGSQPHVDNDHLLSYGATQGANSGLNTLSNFELDRVNRIHPIIAINGGKLVTVIFLHGFFLRHNTHNNSLRGEHHDDPSS